MIENKYKKWYYGIIQKASSQNRKKLNRFDKNYVYYEKHHILPKSLGGTNDISNLILLTAREHYVCHLLLCKFTEGKDKLKMINAVTKMVFSKSSGQERRYSSKDYEKCRALIAERNSVFFKGVRKSEKMRKKLSQSRKGMKFSDEHKKNLSIVRKGKNTGQDNPFFGKTHSKKTKENWSKKRKGIAPPFNGRGTFWYTNGVIDKMCFPDNIPEGFYRGRTKNRRNKNATQS